MIEIDDVEAELDKLDRVRRSAFQNLIVFLASLAVFAGAHVLNASWLSAAILIVVILVHESGHWLAMKYYGYRDLQMFFIPFFGAAVSGKPSAQNGKDQAIVSLMGPAPGIFIGIACGFLYLKWPQPLLIKYAVTSVFLNGFNLLPIYPLDGGRFMEGVLFLKHPVAELAFKVLAALALAALALRSSSISMGLFAVVTAMLARESYIQGKIARRLSDERGDQPSPLEERIPRADLERVLPFLSMGLPQNQIKAKTLANRAVSVWRRIRQQSPSIRASIALLAIYLGIFLVGAAGAVTYIHLEKSAFSRTMLTYSVGSDGTRMAFEDLFWKQVKVSEVQLNSEGLFDGHMTVWTRTGVKKEEGNWAKGFWQGDWPSYDSAGKTTSIRTYENGRPVRYQILKDGALVEVSPDQWPFLFKKSIQTVPGRSAEKPFQP